eukprot:TCONS_00035047-protein
MLIIRHYIKSTSKSSTRCFGNYIPYHPSITLGHSVCPKLIENSKRIRQIEEQEENVHHLEYQIRSLEKLKREYYFSHDEKLEIEDKIEEFELQAEGLTSEIASSSLSELSDTESKIQDFHNYGKCLVDLEKSTLRKDVPFGNNAVRLNTRYFPFNGETRNQDFEAKLLDMKSFIGSELYKLGSSISGKVLQAVHQQTIKQLEENDITGTLVITAVCNHAEASKFSPMVFDIEKSVELWNSSHKDDLFEDTKDLVEDYIQDTKLNNNSISYAAGAVYGSCFVGMLHTLKQKPAGSLIHPSYQAVLAHVSLVSEGCIPTIASDKVTRGAKILAEKQLNDTRGIMFALSYADIARDNVLAMNSLMTAIENYSTQVREGQCGAPIKFFIDSFDKKKLAEMWLKKKESELDPESEIGIDQFLEEYKFVSEQKLRQLINTAREDLEKEIVTMDEKKEDEINKRLKKETQQLRSKMEEQTKAANNALAMAKTIATKERAVHTRNLEEITHLLETFKKQNTKKQETIDEQNQHIENLKNLSDEEKKIAEEALAQIDKLKYDLGESKSDQRSLESQLEELKIQQLETVRHFKDLLRQQGQLTGKRQPVEEKKKFKTFFKGIFKIP